MLFTACGRPHPSNSRLDGFVNTAVLWPNPQAIPVCWINLNEVDVEVPQTIESALQDSYQTFTNVRFTGFESCRAEDLAQKYMIKVLFKRLTRDWAQIVPNALLGGMSFIGPNEEDFKDSFPESTTMVLYTSVNGNLPPIGDAWRENAIKLHRNIAMHEFGHALGLEHEHLRPDAPSCTADARQPLTEKRAYVGSYDPDSIMSYCRHRFATNITVLDIEAVNFLYPSKVEGN